MPWDRSPDLYSEVNWTIKLVIHTNYCVVVLKYGRIALNGKGVVVLGKKLLDLMLQKPEFVIIFLADVGPHHGSRWNFGGARQNVSFMSHKRYVFRAFHKLGHTLDSMVNGWFVCEENCSRSYAHKIRKKVLRSNDIHCWHENIILLCINIA